jgi:hypothetical protein
MNAIDRVLAIAAPLLALLLLSDLIDGVLRSVETWEWNDVRLARGIALWYGYPLYPAHGFEGPIIGTMHGPLPHLLYSCLAFLKDPTWLLISGCCLSCLLYFGAVLWLHLRTGRSLGASYGFFACTSLLLAVPATRYHGLTVHVDALAICCAMVAAGLLIQTNARARTASAVFAMLAIACKQTVAPAAIALAVFVLAVDGRRAFVRYIAVEAAASAAIFAGMLALFRPPRALLFNTFTLAANLPRSAGLTSRILEGLYQIRGDLASVAAPLFLLLAVAAFDTGSIREKICEHRWLVFLCIAVFQLPVELRAWSTAGGDDNHLGVVILFVTLATTVGSLRLWQSSEHPAHAWRGLAARGLLIGILAANIPIPFTILRDVEQVRKNPTQMAFDYERRHPGHAYFPYNPLAALLADHRLTHFDHALLDRELGGFPITQKQFAAGVPPGLELIAYPPPEGPQSAILHGLLKDTPIAQERELKRWRVYRLRPAATQSTSGSPP